MVKDLERYLSVIPSEVGELEGFNYFEFLQQTFIELKAELETNGNTQRFRDIQKERGQKILSFWKNLAVSSQQAAEGRNIRYGYSLELEDGSQITVGISQNYEREDEYTLHITKRGVAEEHEVSITVSEDHGLDEFLYPPKVKSRFKREDEERKEYHFEIVFRENKISTITRAIVYIHQDFQLPTIKQVEALDTSSFGVEPPILDLEDQGKK